MKNTSTFRSIIVLILLLINLNAKAAIEQFSERLEGSQIAVNQTVTLYDGKYFDMNNNPFWTAQYQNKNVKNKVTLGLNKKIPITTAITNGVVRVEITTKKWNGNSFVAQPAIVQDLSVNYSLDGTLAIDDLSTYVFEGAHFVSVKIISITNIPVTNVFLELNVDVERYYTFNAGVVEGEKYSFVGLSNDYIEFSWNTKKGAESYDLEWVHINDYTDGVTFLDKNSINYDFYLNATRINTKENFYKIPNIFDHGYIVFRVRANGVQTYNYLAKKVGSWGTTESGTIGTYLLNQTIAITTEFQKKMNWSHQVGYAEEGKRFESISYSDGLGRTRQSVTHNTETKQSVVSNVYFDKIGRPLVNDLPTPVDGENLRHKVNFNLADVANNPPYSNLYFYAEDPSACEQHAVGFATTSGAGKYYSPLNPNVQNVNANIPDAEKFPFSQITYLKDLTGRVDKISIAGETLKMGAGHEMEFAYPSSDQKELSKLFGAEVGTSQHYQKMVTIDPNGQSYVQYADMAGRVVASFLAGRNPTNLDAIPMNESFSTTTIVENGQGQIVDPAVPSSEVNYSQYIYQDGLYKFNYGFTPQQFATCLTNICFDCVYDLQLKISDDCGVVWEETISINGQNFDNMCNGVTPYTYSSKNSDPTKPDLPYKEIDLKKGEYTIVKKLTVNQEAINAYWCAYADENTCKKPLSTYFNEVYKMDAFVECTPKFEEPQASATQGDCDAYKEMMAYDFSPGGQYAKYTLVTIPPSTDPVGIVCTDPTSILYTGILPAPLLAKNYKTVSRYFDENGVELFATINGVNKRPSELTLEEFVLNFEESWLNSLLPYHPEYCYLQFCKSNESTSSYDLDFAKEVSFGSANMKQYFVPIAGNPAAPTFSNNSVNPALYDPFFMQTGKGFAYVNQMKQAMNNYIALPIIGGTKQLSMYQYAALLSSRCNFSSQVLQTEATISACITSALTTDFSCIRDLIWINFRDLYTEKKQEFFYLAQQDYVRQNNCSNECIGAITPCTPPKHRFATKTPRFGNVSQFGATAPTVGSTTTEILKTCYESCHTFADEWIEKLSECAFNSPNVDTTGFKQRLVQLCSEGCSTTHPMGSSTNMNGDGIDMILAEFGIPINNLCTQNLIGSPAPYRPSEAVLSSFQTNLDQCSCEILTTIEIEFGSYKGATLPPNVTTTEDLLFLRNGVRVNDIDNLLCICKQLNQLNATGTLPQGWGNINGIVQNPSFQIPAELGCQNEDSSTVVKTNDCISCEIITKGVTHLMQNLGYSDYTTFSEATNFEEIMTNYFNNEHFFNLTFEDYSDFYQGCVATNLAPFCVKNPITNEWLDMMKIITYKGQLLTSASTPLDLNVDNIVYKKGFIKNTLKGKNYWSVVNGNNLSLFYGTPTQNCSIVLTNTQNIRLDRIISFEEVVDLPTACGNNSNFNLLVKYIDCGVVKSAYLAGVNNCFNFNTCYCGDTGQKLCNYFTKGDPTPCYKAELDRMFSVSSTNYMQAFKDMYVDFKQTYNAVCSQAFKTENFNYSGTINAYQFTLFYYDQAGNLVKTVAPKGIDFDYANAKATAQAPFEDVPNHTFKTEYSYNSYNQVVSTTNPDQIGATNYFYDYYGRTVASQNPVQKDAGIFSYSLYDAAGRPIEVGQVKNTTPLTEIILKSEEMVVGTNFLNWVKLGVRSEVTRTIYDQYGDPSFKAKFSNSVDELAVFLRITSVLYYKNYSSNILTYESAVHYSYDIHGHVKEQIQDVPLLKDMQQDVKSTQYNYELLSGNVKKVSYQKGKKDYIAHEYIYDRLNRLTEVYTTTNDVHKAREAHYRYYDYGPLARTELGEHKVQGMDYAYTINGSMKAMNSGTLNTSRDMGRDGLAINASNFYLGTNKAVNNNFARDVVGYTIGYFEKDYKPIGASTMEAIYSGTPFGTASKPLYNSNIRNVTLSIDGFATIGNVYQYDQLNRLTDATSYFNTSFPSSNSWLAGVSSQDFHSSYKYDLNGNITNLVRNGKGSTLLMDNMTYNYDDPDPERKKLWNRLDYVIDAGVDYTTTSGGSTIPLYSDIKTGQATTNYKYDNLGQLVEDLSEKSKFEWRIGDKKINKVIRTSSSTAPDLEFLYNPFGQRVIKIIKNRVNGVIVSSDLWLYFYYSYDAGGQVMAMYEIVKGTNLKTAYLKERNIYGISRIGVNSTEENLFTNTMISLPSLQNTILKNNIGNKKYEVTNWLGNVNAVISDRKIVSSSPMSSYEAVILMSCDYYPFGMQIPGRNYSPNNYRFGYNGMEKDSELKGEGNSYTTDFRQYDPRLGRWLSLDPLMSQFPWMSPFVAFDNNPILLIDPLGLASENVFLPESKEKGDGKKGNKDNGWGLEGKVGDDMSTSWHVSGTLYKAGEYAKINERRAMPGQSINLPAGVLTKYSADGKILQSFHYCFSTTGVFAHMEYRDYVGHYDKALKMMVYTDGKGSYYHYTSNHTFDSQSQGYKYMWENTYNHNGTVNTEQIAYITDDGKVHVSTNAFNTSESSINKIEKTEKDGHLYVDGAKVLAQIHTHPKLAATGDCLFSETDIDNAVNIKGGFTIQMNYFGVVEIAYYSNKTKKTEYLPVPEELTRTNLMNGTFNLSEYLKSNVNLINE